jgi:hypothetical protein
MSNRTYRWLAWAAIATAGTALAACGGGGGGDGSPSTSRVKLSITDAPVDSADEVWIQFRAVEFKKVGEEPVVVELRDGSNNPAPRSINLLPLQGGQSAVLLDGILLEAGDYEWARLIVDNEPNIRDSYLMVEGKECELRIPSGDESGLKMQGGFSLPADGSVAFTVDFDLRKSLRAPPGQKGMTPDCTQAYLMKPVLRMVRDSQVGGLSGTVSSELFGVDPAVCSRMVYIYADAADAEAGSTTPFDYDGTDPDPVQMIKADEISGYYVAAFLPAGKYTVAFTCDEDDLEASEELDFTATRGATVQANLVTTGVDLPEPPPAP